MTPCKNPLPKKLAVLKDQKVAKLFCGTDHTFAVLETGEVYAWGLMTYSGVPKKEWGPAPEYTSDTCLTAKLVPSLTGKKVIQIETTERHLMAVTESGEVYSWGICGHGVRALPNYGSPEAPELVTFFAGKRVLQVALGKDHSLFLTDDGVVHACGWNVFGQVGDGSGKEISMPVALTIPEKIKQISAGDQSSFALSESGKIYYWGSEYPNKDNWAKLPTKTVPTLKSSVSDKVFVKMVSGSDHTLLLDGAGTLWVWGKGNFGCLGLGGDISYMEHPCELPASNFGEEKIKDMRAGHSFSIAITATGKIYAWGKNDEGQVGNGSHSAYGRRNTPQDISESFE